MGGAVSSAKDSVGCPSQASDAPGSQLQQLTESNGKSAAPKTDTSSKGQAASLPPVADAAPSPQAPSAEFTLQDLTKHKNFIAINGKVYDLSNFKHPGGPFTIAAVKGKDGTQEFKQKHGSKCEKILKSKGIRIVGVLVK